MKQTLTFLLATVLTSRTAGFALVGPTPAVKQPTTINSLTSIPSETELIDSAERFMTKSGGYYSPLNNETFLADDFVFRGPVIGPLNKGDYAEVLEYFKIYKALPDVAPNCFGYVIDPSDPLRVWFQVRATGTYQQPLGGAAGEFANMVSPPDGREYRGSTETWSLTFNDKLQVRQITGGYVVDRFEKEATTGGRGLSFGILASIGLPFPTAPGDPILRLIQWASGMLDGPGGLLPKTKSESVPEWWTSEKRGADP
jgi:hypothetical protein